MTLWIPCCIQSPGAHLQHGVAFLNSPASTQFDVMSVVAYQLLSTELSCSRTAGVQHQPVTPGRGRRSGRPGSALACCETLQESGDGLSGLSQNTQVQADFDDSTMPAVPKRPRTGAYCTYLHPPTSYCCCCLPDDVMWFLRLQRWC